MWSMVAQRLTQITPPAATPDQVWQLVEAAWSAVPQEHIQSLFESMPGRVAAEMTRRRRESKYGLSCKGLSENFSQLTNCWAGHLARMNEDRCSKKFFLEKPMGNSPWGLR
ncbi:hypothetical protein TNCV_2041951 [Trichonephila clavipes]|nr:hypothetical protein TNCV_2041951 [Trichonephila clavipes]